MIGRPGCGALAAVSPVEGQQRENRAWPSVIGQASQRGRP